MIPIIILYFMSVAMITMVVYYYEVIELGLEMELLKNFVAIMLWPVVFFIMPFFLYTQKKKLEEQREDV